MNAIKRFFQEDIPAVFSAGKWRVSLMQSRSRLSQLEKNRASVLTELGSKAWESRVRDDRYAAVYSKLEELDVSLVETQQAIDSKQAQISQETEHLNTTRTEFDGRLKSIQDQRQVAVQKLSQLQANQKSIEARTLQLQTSLNQGRSNIQGMQNQIAQLQASSQPDKDEKILSLQSTISTVETQILNATSQMEAAKAEAEANRSEQVPVKNEVDGFNQMMNMLQGQSQSALAAIQETIKRYQQDLLQVSEKKNKLLSQMNALMPDLGNQVYRHRPASDALSAAYAKADGVSNEIREVNDQVNLTQARLASVSSGSIRKVAFAGGALLFVLLCIGAFALIVVPAVSNALQPNPKRDIRLVESWTLESCSVYGASEDYLDISVWENRRNDAAANIEISLRLLGSNEVVLDSSTDEIEIAPGGLAVSVQGVDSKGSRIDKVERSVNFAQFDTSTRITLQDVDVKTFFERSRDDGVVLSLDVSNASDFALEPAEIAYAFVVNQQDHVIDILIANSGYETIPVDSLSSISFQSLNLYDSVSCLQSDYSNETVTFWYFVPLRIATSSGDLFTVSGKAVYSP